MRISVLRLSSAICAAVCATVLLLAPGVRAEGDLAIDATIIGAGSLPAVPGLVLAVGNGVYLARGERANLGWRVSGFIFGGLNLAVGTAFVATSPQGFGKLYVPQFGIGMVNLVVGAADIVLSALSTARPEGATPRATVVPMPVADARGRVAPGIGVQVVTF